MEVPLVREGPRYVAHPDRYLLYGLLELLDALDHGARVGLAVEQVRHQLNRPLPPLVLELLAVRPEILLDPQARLQPRFGPGDGHVHPESALEHHRFMVREAASMEHAAVVI